MGSYPKPKPPKKPGRKPRVDFSKLPTNPDGTKVWPSNKAAQ